MEDLMIGLLVLGTFSGVIPAIVLISLFKLLGIGAKAARGEIGMTEDEIAQKNTRKEASLQTEERKNAYINRRTNEIHSQFNRGTYYGSRICGGRANNSRYRKTTNDLDKCHALCTEMGVESIGDGIGEGTGALVLRLTILKVTKMVQDFKNKRQEKSCG